MCGILGISHLNRSLCQPELVHQATQTVRHRGPDDEGYLFANTSKGIYHLAGGPDTPEAVWNASLTYRPQTRVAELSDEDNYNLALVNRRLSILDLSPAGHQPLCNEDQTLWIVHNGEIYNFRELRQELQAQGHCFASETDTEVILHAYEQWGPDCLKRFNGMWAFAIWDLHTQKLFCSRDRFGIKPFYYYSDGQRFLFASEIKALLAFPQVPRQANERAIYRYLMSGQSDHGRETFFVQVQQLFGGEFLELDLRSGEFNVQRYWQLDPTAKNSTPTDEAAAQVRELLTDAVRLRLISDAPVGTCLSGGLDSSAIVCLVNQLIQQNRPEALSVGELQKTFSARYQDARHDEGRFIEVVAQATQAEAHATYPTSERLTEDLEALLYAQEEPFGTTSIFAQWCVFALAQEAGVKVTLDGQGADELLAGYHSYFPAYWAELFRSLRWLRLVQELNGYRRHHRVLKSQLVMMGYNLAPSQVIAHLPRPLKQALRSFVSKEDFHGLSKAFIQSHCLEHTPQANSAKPNNLNALLYQTHIQTSLPALLRYDDRNSMAHSIESRVPFLDHRLVQFVFSLPQNHKIRHGTTKWIFREAMKDILPETVRTRPDKIGFSTPEDEWFRGPLRELVDGVLSSSSFQARPYFDGQQIQLLFERHCRKEINISNFIWRWVNLELWLRRFIDKVK